MFLKKIYRIFARRKPLSNASESKLAKVLTTFDLTSLGIGSTLGVGVYVLAGGVSKTIAGPAVILSFFIAAIASIFAGLCYAEFGARVPKAGSAYVYSYVTIGEFIAFIIGWNLILEYAIGSASVVKGLSTYLDALLNNVMRKFLTENLPMNVSGLSEYPDLFALTVTLLFSIALAFGAKKSSYLNNIFTITNLCVIGFVIIAGLFKVNSYNWNIPKEEVPEGFGSGGFMPYGAGGVIAGAAVCFYGFIGFDCIATAGEEAKDPRKSIPIAICVSLLMVFLAYFGVSTVLTLMLPYYEQNEDAPLPYVFRLYGWTAAEYIVSVGAMFALCASLMGAMFPLPRIVFAMAQDGLLFRFLGEINEKFQTPFISTIVTGILTGILSAVFNLTQLVDMMSIGTLLAYSMVAGCVLILRYKISDDESKSLVMLEKNPPIWRQIFNLDGRKVPSKQSENIVIIAVTTYGVICILFGCVLGFMEKSLMNVEVLPLSLIAIGLLAISINLIIISRQPTASSSSLSFTVPFVPWLPGISILINLYLMMKLDYHTWIRFIIWILIGFFIYFAYGMRNSNERIRQQTKSDDGFKRSKILVNLNRNGETGFLTT